MKPTRTLQPRHGEAARPDRRPAGRTVAGVRVSGDTHPGLQREHNEDRFHCDAARGIFFVVDGVGGHAAGEKAAETAVTVLRERLERETGTVEDRVREAITLANNNIHRLAAWKSEWRGMGCVLTVAIVAQDSVVVGHVGDTRLYKVRGPRLEKITRDHSPVGEREDAKELSEAEAMRHPRRNEVYRDIGSEPHQPGDAEFIDILRVPFEPDAALLLCSDGLSDGVSSAAIAEMIRTYAGHPYEVVRALIDAANDSGGKDNVTVVYVEGPEFGKAQMALPVADPLPLVTPPPAPAPPAAAAAPASSAVDRGRRWRLIALIALLSAVIAAAAWLLFTGWRDGTLPTSMLTGSPSEITVSPAQSIAAAIGRAGAGTTIVVEPGEYREQLKLKSGVRIVSRVPLGASIRLRGDASEIDPAVVAIDVVGGELSGFRIVGDAATPLGSGVYVRDAQVTLSDFEVTGAKIAALELAGAGATVIAASIHDNPGAGLVVRTGASPRISHGEFVRNGTAGQTAGISIDPGARPRLAGNIFYGINPEMMTGLLPAEREAVRHTNWFVASDPVRDSRNAPRPAPADRRAPARRP